MTFSTPMMRGRSNLSSNLPQRQVLVSFAMEVLSHLCNLTHCSRRTSAQHGGHKESGRPKPKLKPQTGAMGYHRLRFVAPEGATHRI